MYFELVGGFGLDFEDRLFNLEIAAPFKTQIVADAFVGVVVQFDVAGHGLAQSTLKNDLLVFRLVVGQGEEELA